MTIVMDSQKKTIAIGEFKAKCLALLERVNAKRERFVITKRGRPIAQVIPLQKQGDDPAKKLRGTLLFEKDIISPIDESWDVGS